MAINLTKLHEPAVKNIQSFIGLLKEDLWNSPDYYERELGSLTDLPDELESLDFDISRGLYNNLMNRFEEIFFIAEGYNVSWRFYKERFYDHLVEDIQILNVQTVNTSLKQKKVFKKTRILNHPVKIRGCSGLGILF